MIPLVSKTIRASSQILRVCKLFYGEALPVLYAENLFFVYDCQELNYFLHQFGKRGASLIRSVMLRSTAGTIGTFAPQLSLLPNLRRFEIYGLGRWDMDTLTDCISRRLWGPLSLRTQPDKIALSERNIPATRIFQCWYAMYPSLQCGVFVSARLKTPSDLPVNHLHPTAGRKWHKRTYGVFKHFGLETNLPKRDP